MGHSKSSGAVGAALIVEDDASLATTLMCFLAGRAERVHTAGTKRQAMTWLRHTRADAALIDLALPDGSGLELLEVLWNQSTMPHVIVISGSSTPEVAFKIAQAGVRAFVPKPLTLEKLSLVWGEMLANPPDVRPLLRCSVGRIELRAMEDAVRDSMIEEALALAESSRRRAAGVLGISRQLLQHIIRSRSDRNEARGR